mmetsp:Transcript_23612/g.72932  ORF Transcript_23612/g.72932 Transcript_23612/m.72932 type:complete len:268 (-) Transcript_23612:350-1153(-)
MSSRRRSKPPKKTFSSPNRPPYASARAMAAGCSTISRSIQCVYGAGVFRSSRSGAVSAREMSNDVPPARTTPISPSCMAMKFFVWRLNADVSDAMNVRPGASPMFMGEPLQATTTASGSATLRAQTPHVPSHLASARSVAFRSSAPPAISFPINWAMTSVSVSDRKWTPNAWSSARKASAFMMTPLWTTPTRSAWSKCGCAFSSVLPPCVAQRVCAMPTWWPACLAACSRTSAMESAVEPLDAYLVTATSHAPPSRGRRSVAMPALS